ncbi:hypothetical protein MTO96_013888 [Rhipicephalus appendiculatus]
MCAPSPVAVRRKFSRFQGGEKRHSFARLLQRPSFRARRRERHKNHAPSSNCEAPSANWVIMLPDGLPHAALCSRPAARPAEELGQRRRVSQRALVRPNQAAELPRGPRRTPLPRSRPGPDPRGAAVAQIDSPRGGWRACAPATMATHSARARASHNR